MACKKNLKKMFTFFEGRGFQEFFCLQVKKKKNAGIMIKTKKIHREIEWHLL